MELINDTDLTVIISGPEVSDVKIFLGTNRLLYIQEISINTFYDEVIPKISLLMPKFVFLPIGDKQPEILPNDVVINIQDFLIRNSSYGSRIYVGNKQVNCLGVNFIANVTVAEHTLTIAYPTEPAESIKLTESIPWVNIKRII